MPPGRQGLRGMLDNIVTDGMRVATEVRRRYEEAQKELEAASEPRRHDDDDDEDDEEVDRKSLYAKDGDLLEGADAEAISVKAPSVKGLDMGGGEGSVKSSSASVKSSGSGEKEAIVEFER